MVYPRIYISILNLRISPPHFFYLLVHIPTKLSKPHIVSPSGDNSLLKAPYFILINNIFSNSPGCMQTISHPITFFIAEFALISFQVDLVRLIDLGYQVVGLSYSRCRGWFTQSLHTLYTHTFHLLLQS